MQQWLGVAVRLLATFEDKVAGRLERNAGLKVVAHSQVTRIAGILFVHDPGHAPECLPHSALTRHSVKQPVGDMLTRDPQRCTILHETDVVDIGNLGAANALVYPAHNVAENALCVVVELRLNRLRIQRRRIAERRRQDAVQACQFSRRELLLPPAGA